MPSATSNQNIRLAVLVSFSGDGGVERMVVNLVHGFIAQGVAVDVLLIKDRGPQVAQLPAAANIIRLGSGHTLLSLPALIRYLRQVRPHALLAAKHRALLIALWARRLSGARTRIVGRLGTTVSAALAGKPRWRLLSWRLPMRAFYPWADGIVAVSEGVAEDVRALTGLQNLPLSVIHNPVITPHMRELARAPAPHPWLEEAHDVPVIIGMGRFTGQKDFLTLIRAFAQVRRLRPCRLILLGRGNLLPEYQALAGQLGVAEDIAYPGFAANPYSYLSRAQLFVLSSAWEGSPNALSEALALGTPVVSTDCPSGPREILQNGTYGPLVAVGDVSALAAAIATTLDAPLPAERLRGAAALYTMENSARRYLEVLGLVT